MPLPWEMELPELAGAVPALTKPFKPTPLPRPPMPWETAGAVDVPFTPPEMQGFNFAPPATLPPGPDLPRPPMPWEGPDQGGPTPGPYTPPPDIPTIPRAQEEPGLLSTIGDVLDRPGNALRGVLAGDPSALLGLIPFSETMGIFGGPEQVGRVSGQELLKRWGLIDQPDPSILSGAGAAGFAAEMLLDPLNLAFGLGAMTKAGKAAKLVGSGLKSADRLLEAERAGATLEELARLGWKEGAATALDSPIAKAGGYLAERGLPMELAQDWATAAKTGQRAMLGVGGEWAPIPFVRPLADLPEKVLIGAPGVEGLAKAGQFAAGLPVVKQIGQLFSRAPAGLEGDAARIMQQEIEEAGKLRSAETARAAEEAAGLDVALRNPELANDVRAAGAGSELISPPLVSNPTLPPELKAAGLDLDPVTGEIVSTEPAWSELYKGQANQLAAEKATLQQELDDLKARSAIQRGYKEAAVAPEFAGATGATVEGRQAPILDPATGQQTAAKYAVMEASDLVPSHDFTGGAPRSRADYPQGLQPRDYGAATQDAAGVFEVAANKRGDLFVNSAPTMDQGPPTVTPDRTVLAGNKRAMALQVSAARNDFDWYKQKLLADAQQYGLDPNQVAGMANPVLVRVVDTPATSELAQRLAGVSNIPTTFTQGAAREAAQFNRVIPDTVLDALKANPELSFNKLLNDVNLGQDVREALAAAMPAAQRAQYFTAAGQLTAAGQEFATQAFLSKVLPIEAIEKVPPALRDKIEAALPALVDMKRGRGANMLPQLREAVEFLAGPLEGGRIRLDDYAGQGAFDFAAKAELSQGGKQILESLLRDSPTDFRKRMAQLVTSFEQEGGGSLLGVLNPETPEQLAARVLGVGEHAPPALPPELSTSLSENARGIESVTQGPPELSVPQLPKPGENIPQNITKPGPARTPDILPPAPSPKAAALEAEQAAIKTGDQVRAAHLGDQVYKVIGAGPVELRLKAPDGTLEKIYRSAALPVQKAGKRAAEMGPGEAQAVISGLQEFDAAQAMPETAQFMKNLGREARGLPPELQALEGPLPSSGTPNERSVSGVAGTPDITAKPSPPPGTQALPSQVSTRPEPSVSSATRSSAPSDLTGPSETRLNVGTLGPSGKIIRQPSASIQENLAAAEKALPEVKATLERLAKEAGGELFGARTKAMPRLLEKLKAGKPAENISDYLGARVWIDSPEAMQTFREAVSKIYPATELDDFLDATQSEAGYRAIHMQAQLPNGHTFELQIMPKAIGQAQEKLHKVYEKWRAMDTFTAEQMKARAADYAASRSEYERAYAQYLRGEKIPFEAQLPPSFEKAAEALPPAKTGPPVPGPTQADLPEPLRPKQAPGRPKGEIAADMKTTRELRDRAQKALDHLPPELHESEIWQEQAQAVARHNRRLYALEQEARTGKAPALGYNPSPAATERASFAQQFNDKMKVESALNSYLQKAGYGTQEAMRAAAELLPKDASPAVHRAITEAIELASDEGKQVTGQAAEIVQAVRDRYAQWQAAEQPLSVPTSYLKDPRLDYTTRTTTTYGSGWFKSLDEKKRGALFVALEDARKARGLEPAGLAAALDKKLAGAAYAPPPAAGKTVGLPFVKRGWGAQRLERLDDATKAFIDDNGLRQEFLAFEYAASNMHPSQIQRLPAFQGLTVPELNEVFRKAGAKGMVFNENPAAQVAVRGARHARALAADQLFKQLDRRLGVQAPEGTVTKPFKDVPGLEEITKDGQVIGYGITEFNDVLGNSGKRGVVFPDLPTAEAAQASLSKILNPKEAEGLLKYFDEFTRGMKAWVTKAFPAYHLRNRLSNRIQSTFDDVPAVGQHYANAHRAMAGQDLAVTLGDGSKVTRDELIREAVDQGVLKRGFFEAEIGMAKTEGFERRSALSKLNPLENDNAYLKAGERFSAGLAQAPGRLLSGAGLKDITKLDASAVEGTDRLGHYLYKRMQGFSPADAAQSVKKSLFNYDELNDFEKNVLGRLVYFYTWQRNAIPLVLETMLHKPGKIRQLTQISGGAGNKPEGGPEILPSWVKEGLPVNFGKDASGNDLVAYGAGTPLEGALEPFAGFAGGFQEGAEKGLASLNPLLRVPLELATGRRFFLHKDIEESRKAPAWMGDLPAELQAAAGVRAVKDDAGQVKRWEAPPELLYLIENSPLGRVSTTAGKAADDRKSATARLLNVLTGAKIVSIDPKLESYYAQKDAIKKKLKEMEREGLVMSPEIFAATAAGKEEAPEEIKALLKGLRAK